MGVGASTCSRRSQQQFGPRNGPLHLHRLAIERVLLLPANSLGEPLLLVHDETESSGFTSFAANHHLGRYNFAVARKIGAELGVSGVIVQASDEDFVVGEVIIGRAAEAVVVVVGVVGRGIGMVVRVTSVNRSRHTNKRRIVHHHRCIASRCSEACSSG